MTVDLDTLFPLMKEYLEQGKEVTFTITGRSMAPTLRHGRDQVTVKKPSGPLRKGDLPLFRRDSGEYVLHRVVGFRDGKYLMCGDGQTRREEGIDDSHILAVAAAITRGGRRISARAPLYRLYVGLWTGLFPVRRYLLGALRRLRPEYFTLPGGKE
ncbi:MAG: S24/S26 family peptidase [Abditibacteriota bacterium]|nr:S24/S26 family peptidase [Abditibacteriota bacterium]